MTLRIKSFLVAGSLIATVAGCNEPEGLVPVAPPGFEIVRVPPQTEEPQAIGETGLNLKTPPKSSTLRPNAPSCPPTEIGKPIKTASGLIYETLKEGTGAVAQAGQAVTIHYTGTLTDGTVFDTSRERNKPYTAMNIGQAQLIAGWNEGVPGMKIGERRKLTIPPELGYGPAGSPPKIPGNSTLIFDIELLDAR